MSDWSPPTPTAKSAKADAKAAKARAKALRPWFKKKRWWLAGIAVIAVIAAAAGNSTTTTVTSSDTPSQNESSGGIDQGIGSKDASADLVDIDCGAPDSIGITYPKVTVKNNSSKPSDYQITLVAESADGSTKYDDAIIFIFDLQPGQQQTEEGMFTADFPSGAICKVTEFQRTAAL